MNTQTYKRLKLLLVDDDDDLLALMRLKLQREGYDVSVSHNGQLLDEMIKKDMPDAILLDIHMHGINGGDICRKLKTQQQTRKIIILLLSSNTDIRDVCKVCGADGYFEKPLNMPMLEKKLEEQGLRAA